VHVVADDGTLSFYKICLTSCISHRCYCTDLSRAIDSSVKDKVKDITGNDDYEFGDLR
jgi:hypothetical protein